MPWRKAITPYAIFVSELMLQQTPVSRVIPKYKSFITAFPNFRALAKAPLSAVLREWQGLGYNRRGAYAKRAAEIIVAEHGGRLPKTVAELVALPGIGPNTAGAMLAYAYDMPALFIETNIRRSFIYFFFPKRKRVSDAELLPLISAAATGQDPRTWHWALMDYGSMLGSRDRAKNPNRRSAHYAKQSKFEGSRRQVRGKVLKFLLGHKQAQTVSFIAKYLGTEQSVLLEVLDDLAAERLLKRVGQKYGLAK